MEKTRLRRERSCKSTGHGLEMPTDGRPPLASTDSCETLGQRETIRGGRRGSVELRGGRAAIHWDCIERARPWIGRLHSAPVR